MAVFVLDRHGKPLMPCSEKRARTLLAAGRARVHRLLPFAIRITDRTVANSAFQDVQLKLDPGSKTTGVALVRPLPDAAIAVLNLFDLVHRGHQISEALAQRANFRRRRRSAHLRYRRPGFNDNKPEGWLAPSLRHRVETTDALLTKLRRLAPITSVAMELVRFDMHAMQNPEISGVEYQRGELAGYEIREYLLEKFGRKCMYCDAQNVPLNLDHIHPRARGGSDRVSNIGLACVPCNTRKSARPVQAFVKDPARLARILAKAKAPLRDASAVNATRWRLKETLSASGLPVSTGSGGQTKFNRSQLAIPKTHALDAVCVGRVTAAIGWQVPTLVLKCMGRGSYQRTRLDKFGFPRGKLARQKQFFGFQTGDRVRAIVTKGKKVGAYEGRVAVRVSGNFNIQTATDVVQGINHRYCSILQRNDGYAYSFLGKVRRSCGPRSFPPRPEGRGISEQNLMNPAAI